MSNFGNFVWLVVSTFVFLAYILVMFHIVVDLFRDTELGGFSKALWICGLIFVPILTALIYVVTRGKAMAERQRAAMQRSRAAADAYIGALDGTSSTDQIVKAKSLLESGTINQDEFMLLKQRALA